MMKRIAIIFLIFAGVGLQAQSDFPALLNGSWQLGSEPVIEQWTELGNNHLKGFSYNLMACRPDVMEYLDISRKDSGIYLEAFVPGQNNNEAVYFKMEKSGTSYIFQNPKHDYPTKIMYNFLSKDEVQVEISGNQPSISYLMRRMEDGLTAKGPGPEISVYDPVLAERLGADENGMKDFYFVLITTGDKPSKDTAFVNSCFKGHFENMTKMEKEGKLVVAGPFGKNADGFRGIFILQHTGTKEETLQYLQGDTAIREGILKATVYPWYGSAALPEYLPLTKKITKNSMF